MKLKFGAETFFLFFQPSSLQLSLMVSGSFRIVSTPIIAKVGWWIVVLSVLSPDQLVNEPWSTADSR